MAKDDDEKIERRIAELKEKGLEASEIAMLLRSVCMILDSPDIVRIARLVEYVGDLVRWSGEKRGNFEVL